LEYWRCCAPLSPPGTLRFRIRECRKVLRSRRRPVSSITQNRTASCIASTDFKVVLLIPGEPENRGFGEARSVLGAYENFTLAGIAGIGDDGRRTHVYVHAKTMLIDDSWATIGSANLHRFSLYGNNEMNASFRDPPVVREFRCELFREHLDEDTASLNDREALRLFGEIAQENRIRQKAGDFAWSGLAFALDITTYGAAIHNPSRSFDTSPAIRAEASERHFNCVDLFFHRLSGSEIDLILERRVNPGQRISLLLKIVLVQQVAHAQHDLVGRSHTIGCGNVYDTKIRIVNDGTTREVKIIVLTAT